MNTMLYGTSGVGSLLDAISQSGAEPSAVWCRESPGWSVSGKVGGAEGDRTPDLVIANDALSQLSYSPITSQKSK